MHRSILYQRGIYPAESFQQRRQYGLTMMVTSDPGLTQYLTSVLQQMSGTARGLPRPAQVLCVHACTL